MQIGGKMIIVLTGGIGSGKSTAAGILRDTYGFPVYEADAAVKRLYRSDESLLSDIETDAGRMFRNEDGDFSASLMAEYVFSVPGAVEKVERRVFPVLVRDFMEWKSATGADIVVFESATILEKPYFKGFGDAVIIVDAALDMRIDRAVARDGVTREQVLARVGRQKLMNDISDGRNIPEDAYICRNDGSLAHLSDRLNEIIEIIINK
jgi:dephospho-CoA kinase